MAIVLASPIRQSPEVLGPFLRSIEETGCDVWLYDDNDSLASAELIYDFCAAAPGRKVLPPLDLGPSARTAYRRLDTTHLWTVDTFTRVGQIKDAILARFAASDYDALMLVDSDLVIHQDLPARLDNLGLPIVSEVFWTKWSPDDPLLPQVWQQHIYGFTSADWIRGLVQPGVYPVAGLGACTLLRRAGITSFAPLDGWTRLGEDRYFCIRANVRGIPLHVDTHFPAYHMYRDENVAFGANWQEAGCSPDVIRASLDNEWFLGVQRWMNETYALGPEVLSYAGGTEPWVTDLLVALCRSIGAKRVLEIGVLKGTTTAALARAAQSVVAIDTVIQSAVVNAVLPHRNVQLIEGDATAVIPTLDGEFDVVYVDDGHTYEAVKAQTAAVWPKVAPAGILAFHDYYDAGVCAFIQERFPEAIILETRPFVERSTGLALVQKQRR